MHAVSSTGGFATVIDPHAEARLLFERTSGAGDHSVALAIAVDRQGERARSRGARGRTEAFEALTALVAEAIQALPGTRSAVTADRVDGLFVLVPRLEVEAGQALARRLLSGARDDARLASVSIGLAHDGQRTPVYFETLCEVAERGLDVACAGGGDRLAQTDLYGLVQRRLEREGEAEARRHEARATIGLEPTTQTGSVSALMSPGEYDGSGAGDHAERLLSAIRSSAAGRLDSDPAQRERLAFEEAALHDLRALEAARDNEHRHEVERLERRIAKLANALKNAEGEISRLATVKSIDPGVASVYQTVQGLDPDDLNQQLKKELLETVFVSNRQLLEMIESQR